VEREPPVPDYQEMDKVGHGGMGKLQGKWSDARAWFSHHDQFLHCGDHQPSGKRGDVGEWRLCGERGRSREGFGGRARRLGRVSPAQGFTQKEEVSVAP
jgi:hypothetical protein